jgi:hypothetical protein
VLNRVFGPAALMLEQAEQMKGLRVTGIDRKYLTANPLRLRRPSGTLIIERCTNPDADLRRWTPRRVTLLAQTGFGSPPLSIHRA